MRRAVLGTTLGVAVLASPTLLTGTETIGLTGSVIDTGAVTRTTDGLFTAQTVVAREASTAPSVSKGTLGTDTLSRALTGTHLVRAGLPAPGRGTFAHSVDSRVGLKDLQEAGVGIRPATRARLHLEERGRGLIFLDFSFHSSLDGSLTSLQRLDQTDWLQTLAVAVTILRTDNLLSAIRGCVRWLALTNSIFVFAIAIAGGVNLTECSDETHITFTLVGDTLTPGGTIQSTEGLLTCRARVTLIALALSITIALAVVVAVAGTSLLTEITTKLPRTFTDQIVIAVTLSRAVE